VSAIEPDITPELAAAHGLKRTNMRESSPSSAGRRASPTRYFLGHVERACSYKSSRIHLRKLPTKAPCGDPGQAKTQASSTLAMGLPASSRWKATTTPPSSSLFKAPRTGVGGILRDVFTMGARPVACLNLLRFGPPEHPRTRHLVAGVVAGIGAYGNSFGVPTVGGSTNFDKSYDGNILVNAMAVGHRQGK